MGEQNVKRTTDAAELRSFMKSLLRDVRAMEKMLADGCFEEGIRRIGAEQELFLVDRAYRPAQLALDVLDRLTHSAFTTELGKFNLEFNLDPYVFGGKCLSEMEQQLYDRLAEARDAAEQLGAQVVLTGILPTLKQSDLTVDAMTPNPRYYALNEAMNNLRGGDYHFHIEGTDEFMLRHDSVMVEAANTSFQVHFQVSPHEFANLYNIAQAVAAPTLAVATNSPLLLGKRLWRETRIALFQQSIDTREAKAHIRDSPPRVSFGNKWLDSSVLEIFKDDIARFRVLLGLPEDEDPFDKLARGDVPQLLALRLHNSTVYRWNRPCYGIGGGKPHLRIENRVLPAGPTIVDEVANAAFWFGLMAGCVEEYPDITKLMEFDEAKANFLGVARQGLGAALLWADGKQRHSAADLVQNHFLPLAREGLKHGKIDDADADRYLGIIAERVESGQTGSVWTLESLAKMPAGPSLAEKLSAITAATITRQKEREPVHTWPLANLNEAAAWRENYYRVEQYMKTDFLSVNENELIDLVASIMEWQHIRHVPVEDAEHRLVGIVTNRLLLRMLTTRDINHDLVPVSDIMQTEVITIPPETRTLDAIRIMRREKVGCLPVVKEGRLVGMVTETDFMEIARELLEEKLSTQSSTTLPALIRATAAVAE